MSQNMYKSIIALIAILLIGFVSENVEAFFPLPNLAASQDTIKIQFALKVGATCRDMDAAQKVACYETALSLLASS